MKKTRILFTLFIITAISIFIGIKHNSINDTDKAIKAFKEFLNNERKAYSQNDKLVGIDIDSITIPKGEPEKHYASGYAFFDSNGDDIPELHKKSARYYYILIYNENDLYIWDSAYPQTIPLNNRGFLYTHSGSAPDHEEYLYYMLDFYGNEIMSNRFSRYDSNGNGGYEQGKSTQSALQKMRMENILFIMHITR